MYSNYTKQKPNEQGAGDNEHDCTSPINRCTLSRRQPNVDSHNEEHVTQINEAERQIVREWIDELRTRYVSPSDIADALQIPLTFVQERFKAPEREGQYLNRFDRTHVEKWFRLYRELLLVSHLPQLVKARVMEHITAVVTDDQKTIDWNLRKLLLEDEQYSMLMWPIEGMVKIFPPGPRKRLRKSGYRHFWQICLAKRNDIAEIPGVGPKTLAAIEAVMLKEGAGYDMSDAELGYP